jgi:hypothetical protein
MLVNGHNSRDHMSTIIGSRKVNQKNTNFWFLNTSVKCLQVWHTYKPLLTPWCMLPLMKWSRQSSPNHEGWHSGKLLNHVVVATPLFLQIPLYSPQQQQCPFLIPWSYMLKLGPLYLVWLSIWFEMLFWCYFSHTFYVGDMPFGRKIDLSAFSPSMAKSRTI